MAYGRREQLRLLLPLGIIIMILMRLVWMQLRTYPTQYDPRALLTLGLARQALDHPAEACVKELPAPAIPGLSLDPAQLDLSPARKALLGSPGFTLLSRYACADGRLSTERFLRLNQALLMATVFLATLMARFLTSSWTIALVVGVTLMSRGELIAALGDVSSDGAVALACMFWLTACVHFLRTGSRLALGAATLAVCAGALFEPALLGLSLAMPVFLCGGYLLRRRLAIPVVRRFRQERRQKRLAPARWPVPSERPSARVFQAARRFIGIDFSPAADVRGWRGRRAHGGLFTTIEAPFTLWVFTGWRWKSLCVFWLLVALLTAALAVGANAFLVAQPLHAAPVLRSWFAAPMAALSGPVALVAALGELASPFDRHLTISLGLLLICAFQSPADGLLSFFEAAWLSLIGFAGVAALALVLDLVNASELTKLPGFSMLAFVHSHGVFRWLGPAVLSLGIVGAYNLLKVIDTAMARPQRSLSRPAR